MELWSLSFVIEDKFKNVFSEYVEDFEGYLSSSLFNNEEINKKDDSIQNIYINIKNNLGEFHQNQFWMLDVLLSKKPNNHLIETKLNSLARTLNINEYYVNDLNLKKKKMLKKLV